MIASMQRFWLSAWLSYRALFTWLNPWGYVSSRIVQPLFVTVLFGAVGAWAGSGVTRPVVGGALMALCFAALLGVNLSVANERQFGTLGTWLSTPEPLAASLAGKAAVHVVDGFVGAVVTLAVAAMAFGVAIPAPAALRLLPVAAAVTASGLGLGLVCAAAAVRWRDGFAAPNIFQILLIAISGAFVAPGRLPLHLGELSVALPLSRGVPAAMAVVDGAAVPWTALAGEVAIGVAWGAFGYAAFRLLLRRARTAATLDLL